MKSLTQFITEALKSFNNDFMTNYASFIKVGRHQDGNVSLESQDTEDGGLDSAFKYVGLDKDKYNGYILRWEFLTDEMLNMLKTNYLAAYNADFDTMWMGEVGQIAVYIFVNKQDDTDIKIDADADADPYYILEALKKMYLPLLQNHPKNPTKDYYQELTGALINAVQYSFTNTDLGDNKKVYSNFVKAVKDFKG